MLTPVRRCKLLQLCKENRKLYPTKDKHLHRDTYTQGYSNTGPAIQQNLYLEDFRKVGYNA
jgi:hypothetical protein